ncbi:MAG: hypothetical protein CM15mP79_1300 [Methanobacteriota archaeon]|nr:MAG: hypothetical protein CM15mP79_1300 [Euryarchaeota archaeon]
MAWDTQMAQNVGELTFAYGVVGVNDDRCASRGRCDAEHDRVRHRSG